MSQCAKKTSIEAAEENVRKYVRSAASTVTKSIGVQWVRTELDICHEMLYYAANYMPVPFDLKRHYESSWLASEGITYIESESESENAFHLRVNFPHITTY